MRRLAAHRLQCLPHRLLRTHRQLAAIVPGLDRLAHINMGGQRPSLEHRIERVLEREVIDIRWRHRLPPLRILIQNAEWLHRPPSRHRRLEHIRVKRLERQAIRCRAFRKHAHQLAARKTLGQLVHDALRVAAFLTLDEHRVEVLREPADQRPVADLSLRDKRRRPPRVNHVDVDPRNVIAHDERARVEPRRIVVHD